MYSNHQINVFSAELLLNNVSFQDQYGSAGSGSQESNGDEDEDENEDDQQKKKHFIYADYWVREVHFN